ncbi:hypothetical protein ACIF8W_03720 [Streptomyces sp. NPDC085639]|uniref:hypothetical protein n=1 Tax=Streptomyces sp. NPDC085639 TaxID=3365734 RepID=UPI0037D2EF07
MERAAQRRDRGRPPARRGLFSADRLLPGLCLGRSGAAWALFDSARLPAGAALADRAIALVEQLPTRRPSPDVTHGLSGAGTACLHLWRATADESGPPGCRRAGHFLLDMAGFTGGARYRPRAEGIAALIEAEHCESDGLRLVAAQAASFGSRRISMRVVRRAWE